MKALPIELRERIVTAVNEGETTISVAKRFKVSWSSVKRYVRQAKEQGHLKHGKSTGRPRKLTAEQHDSLYKKLTQDPDLQLKEYCDWLSDTTGVSVGITTMHRLLAEMRMTRKKDLSSS